MYNFLFKAAMISQVSPTQFEIILANDNSRLAFVLEKHNNSLVVEMMGVDKINQDGTAKMLEKYIGINTCNAENLSHLIDFLREMKIKGLV